MRSGRAAATTSPPRRRPRSAILAAFLPEQLGEAEIAALVDEAIAATGAAGPRDMGKVMGWLAPRTKGRADGRVVSQAVGAALANLAASGTPGES